MGFFDEVFFSIIKFCFWFSLERNERGVSFGGKLIGTCF